MDHNNRSVINNQLRKPRPSHGRPEWEKTAIRVCGHWSEQLSSKGRIYFYNCVTEVSQWQKPPEWSLPDISKKEIFKLQSNNRNAEDYEQYKKIKLNNQFTRANANDDMDISPNSSPLSDTYSNSKSQSPQKHQIPVSHAFQKPQLFGPKSLANSNISNPVSTTLCQLVDAIRASIDGFLDQSPKLASVRSFDRTFPSTNGVFYPGHNFNDSLRTKVSTSGVDDRPVKSQDVFQVSPKIDTSLNNWRRSLNSDVYSVHSPKKKTAPCVTSVKSISKVNCCDSLKDLPGSVDRTMIGMGRNGRISSPTVFSPHSSNTTSSHTSASVFTGSRGCHLPSHEVEESVDVHHKTCQSTCNRFDVCNVSIQNMKEHTYSSVYVPHDQTSNRLHADNISNLDSRSQNTQLNDLVQVLKVALQQTRHAQSFTSALSNTNTRISTSSDEFLRIPSLDHKHNLDKSSPSAKNKQHFGSLLNKDPNKVNFEICCVYSDNLDLHTRPGSALLRSPNIYTSLTTAAQVANTEGNMETVSLCGIDKTVSPVSLHSISSVSGTCDSIVKKHTPSQLSDHESPCIETKSSSLDSLEMRTYFEPLLLAAYFDDGLERMEQEAHMEAKNFDRLQSVLYAELSAESKKLRALVRISEAKLAMHKEKQSALQELMDAIEVRKQLPNLSFVDDAL